MNRYWNRLYAIVRATLLRVAEAGRTRPRVVSPPKVLDGALTRIVAQDILVWAEVWVASGWVRYGVEVHDVLRAPPASAELLTALGIRL